MVQFGVDEEGQNPSKNACGSRATVALRKETADNWIEIPSFLKSI